MSKCYFLINNGLYVEYDKLEETVEMLIANNKFNALQELRFEFKYWRPLVRKLYTYYLDDDDED